MIRRVVVTGMSVVTSLGTELTDFWEKICAGKSGIGPVQRFDCSDFKVRFGGEIKDFDPRDQIPERELKRLDRFVQFALYAAAKAIQQSGIDFSQGDPFRHGVVTGSGIGGLQEIEDQHFNLLDRGPSRVSPFMIPKLIVNAASGNISVRYGLRGPNSAVATACASANNAIGDAFRAIQYGDADVMITGGSEAAVTPMSIAGFANMTALSERNDDPATASRPFDKGRDGFVMGEGAGVIILEELGHAQRRGARIYGEIIGYGATGDAYHMTGQPENHEGLQRAMRRALRDGQLSPTDVQYVNAHGTSTPLNDPNEIRGIRAVFGAHADTLNVSSTKSMTGHMLGAAGGVEFIVSLLAIQHGIIPPTINQFEQDPECDLNVTPNTPVERRVDAAISNSSGFGGHNVALAVRRFEA